MMTTCSLTEIPSVLEEGVWSPAK